MGAAMRAQVDAVGEFASAAAWFAETLARVPPATPVPTCPGWSVLDLATHLGNVHSWAASVVETGRAAEGLDSRPPSHRPRRLAEWYLGRAEDLYAVLRDTPPDQPCWNFAYGAGVAGFWRRRQLHETVVHGVDLAIAGDREERLPADVAADGVDEVLTVFLHRMHHRGYPADLAEPLVLSATDVGRSWTVQPVRGEVPPQPGPGESRLPSNGGGVPRVLPDKEIPAADAVAAPAGVLLKLLWKRARPSDPAVRLRGDRERIHRFLASRLTP